MRQPTVVFLFGPPGSGKSAQAGLLADTLAFEVVDVGRIVRAAVYDPARQGDPEVARERMTYDTGGLMSAAFVTSEIKDHLGKILASRTSCVFGGFPRTLDQAQAGMPEIVATYGIGNVFAFLLDTPLAVCRERNKARSSCTVCGRPQLGTAPARGIPQRCRVCSNPVEVRADATAIEHRFEAYQEQTVPVFGYLGTIGIELRRIDGSLSPVDVQARIVGALHEGHAA